MQSNGQRMEPEMPSDGSKENLKKVSLLRYLHIYLTLFVQCCFAGHKGYCTSCAFNRRLWQDMCVYDEHLLASREIQYRATKSWSEYTTTKQARAGRNIHPMTKLEKWIMQSVIRMILVIV